MLDLIQCVQEDIPHIQCPALLVQSHGEHTVRPESATYIFDHLKTPCKELFWLEKSGHVITVDIEREIVFEKIAEFLGPTIIKE